MGCSHQFLLRTSWISFLTAIFPLLVSKKYSLQAFCLYLHAISIPINIFLTAFSQIQHFLKSALFALSLTALHVTALNLYQQGRGGSKSWDAGITINLGLCF